MYHCENIGFGIFPYLCAPPWVVQSSLLRQASQAEPKIINSKERAPPLRSFILPSPLLPPGPPLSSVLPGPHTFTSLQEGSF